MNQGRGAWRERRGPAGCGSTHQDISWNTQFLSKDVLEQKFKKYRGSWWARSKGEVFSPRWVWVPPTVFIQSPLFMLQAWTKPKQQSSNPRKDMLKNLQGSPTTMSSSPTSQSGTTVLSSFISHCNSSLLWLQLSTAPYIQPVLSWRPDFALSVLSGLISLWPLCTSISLKREIAWLIDVVRVIEMC